MGRISYNTIKSYEGYQVEDDIIDHLNGKRFNELNQNWQLNIYKMFPEVDKRCKIRCYRPTFLNEKPDIVIEMKGEKKYISIKSGRNESIHQEHIKDFILFLRENGVSVKTQKTILLFHYGDGTMNGTGKVRYDYEQMLKFLKGPLHNANQELNENKELVLKCFNRFVFHGLEKDFDDVDYIYHGNVERGYLASRGQIEKHLIFKNYEDQIGLHIGPAHINPRARYVNTSIRDERKRNLISVKWVQMPDDISYIGSYYKKHFTEKPLLKEETQA